MQNLLFLSKYWFLKIKSSEFCYFFFFCKLKAEMDSFLLLSYYRIHSSLWSGRNLWLNYYFHPWEFAQIASCLPTPFSSSLSIRLSPNSRRDSRALVVWHRTSLQSHLLSPSQAPFAIVMLFLKDASPFSNIILLFMLFLQNGTSWLFSIWWAST